MRLNSEGLSSAGLGDAPEILRVLREHQMSENDAFLKRLWPGVKKSTEWLIAKDGDGDGLITGNQHNTLDTDWFGPVAWLSGLYHAALLAAAILGLTQPAIRAALESFRATQTDKVLAHPDPRQPPTPA